MAKKSLTVVIKRSKHGVGNKGGRLLDEDTGLMCCLGFVAKKIGLSDDAITGVGCPTDSTVVTSFSAHPVASALLADGKYSNVCSELMNINDDTHSHMSRARREARLTKAAAKIGLKFRFVD